MHCDQPMAAMYLISATPPERSPIASTKNAATADTVINPARPYFAIDPRSLLKTRPFAMVATTTYETTEQAAGKD
jgi:hypothetical protein